MSRELLKVLFIGRDLAFQDKISEAFDENYEIQSVRSTETAALLIQKFSYDVIIFDENILNSENYEGRESVSIKLIYKISILKNIKTIFIYTYEKNSSFVKSFQKLSDSTLFFKKEGLDSSKISYCVTFLKRVKYRSILAREIREGSKYSMPIYFLSKDEKNKKIFLEANKPIEIKILALLKEKKMSHLYVRAEDFTQYIEETSKILKTNQIFTVKLNNIRKRVKKLFIYLADDSSSSEFLAGGIEHKLTSEICADIDKLISSFPDLLSAIEELPFPRTSLLNHCINSTIYTLIFSKICFVAHRDDIAVAALLHDIGLSRADYIHHEKIIPLKFISHPEKINFEEHITVAIEILSDKNISISSYTRDAILTHHELADGTGGPLGKKQEQLEDYQMYIALADYLDELRTINPGDLEKTFADTFKQLAINDTENQQFGKLGHCFNQTILQQVVNFFNIS